MRPDSFAIENLAAHVSQITCGEPLGIAVGLVCSDSQEAQDYLDAEE